MSDIILTSSFNKASFTNNHKKLWSSTNQKVKKSYFKNSVFAVVLLIISITIDEKPGFPVGMSLTGGFCVYILLKWIEFFERRNNYFKLIKKQAHDYEQINITCTSTLSEDWFEYTDDEKTFKFQWHLLKSYNNYDDTVIIGFKNGIYFPFDKEGIDSDTFIRACNFLKAKADINIKS